MRRLVAFLPCAVMIAGCTGQERGAGQDEQNGELVPRLIAANASSTPSATPSVIPARAPDAPPLVACSDSEVALAACTVESGKQMAVCSSEAGQAQYRFGAHRAEITLDGGRFARVGYSGGGEMQIAFDNGDYQYVVFARTVRTGRLSSGEGIVAASDGVVVLNKGEFVGMQLCQPDKSARSYGNKAEERRQSLLQEGDLFTDETARADAVVGP